MFTLTMRDANGYLRVAPMRYLTDNAKQAISLCNGAARHYRKAVTILDLSPMIAKAEAYADEVEAYSAYEIRAWLLGLNSKTLHAVAKRYGVPTRNNGRFIPHAELRERIIAAYQF